MNFLTKIVLTASLISTAHGQIVFGEKISSYSRSQTRTTTGVDGTVYVEGLREYKSKLEDGEYSGAANTVFADVNCDEVKCEYDALGFDGVSQKNTEKEFWTGNVVDSTTVSDLLKRLIALDPVGYQQSKTLICRSTSWSQSGSGICTHKGCGKGRYYNYGSTNTCMWMDKKSTADLENFKGVKVDVTGFEKLMSRPAWGNYWSKKSGHLQVRAMDNGEPVDQEAGNLHVFFNEYDFPLHVTDANGKLVYKGAFRATVKKEEHRFARSIPQRPTITSISARFLATNSQGYEDFRDPKFCWGAQVCSGYEIFSDLEGYFSKPKYRDYAVKTFKDFIGELNQGTTQFKTILNAQAAGSIIEVNSQGAVFPQTNFTKFVVDCTNPEAATKGILCKANFY